MTNSSKKKTSRASRNAGLPPGTLEYIGDKRVDDVTVTVIDYSETDIHEQQMSRPEDCREYINRNTVTWINITGLHNAELLSQFGDIFGFHPLVLEDVIHTKQRPKLEDHEDYIFCVLQMLYRDSATTDLVSEQVSMILGKGYLLTFQEVQGDVFDLIRKRIRAGEGRIRKMGCDYLAYALIDAIVDNYFVVLEDIGEKIDSLQETILSHHEVNTLQEVHKVRRELIFTRKRLWPLRELVGGLEKLENKLVHKSLAPYLRDVYEHTIQVIDNVESLRDITSGVMDVYMTTLNNRTNDVMKVLTVIATIFIPLTFVAGIYGMNFKHMPELKWQYGYVAVWGVMVMIAIAMVVYFKRQKWF